MPLKPNMSLDDVLIYLNADLEATVQNDIYPVIQADKQEGGYFAVPRLVFCYIDYLGALYSGYSGKGDIATTCKAKNYLMNIMSMVDTQYGRQADTLIDVYRHGTVHLFAPLSLKQKTSNRELTWYVYKGTRHQLKGLGAHQAQWLRHLEVYNAGENIDVLPISINCLYDDLRQSIDEYCGLLQREAQSGQSVTVKPFRFHR